MVLIHFVKRLLRYPSLLAVLNPSPSLLSLSTEVPNRNVVVAPFSNLPFSTLTIYSSTPAKWSSVLLFLILFLAISLYYIRLWLYTFCNLKAVYLSIKTIYLLFTCVNGLKNNQKGKLLNNRATLSHLAMLDDCELRGGFIPSLTVRGNTMSQFPSVV